MDATSPRTTKELREALGATPWLFVIDAADNPKPDLDHCADGTIVIWSETPKPGYPPRWYVDCTERGRVSAANPMATFLYEADACWFAWMRCYRPSGA